MVLEDNKTQATADHSDWFFYFLVILIAIYILIKTIQWPTEKRIDVILLQQKGAIENIYTTLDTKFTADYQVDTIHFPEGDELYHHNVGYMGFKNDFFLKVQTQMEVLKAGTYQFSIRSDDGFILSIDDIEVCKFPAGRAMAESLCSSELSKGLHHFGIYYYQGFGYMGLEAKYQLENTSPGKNTLARDISKQKFIGRDSEEVIFHPIEPVNAHADQ